VLQAGTGYSSYTWQDGSAADSFTVKTPGLYSVSAQDYCGHSPGSQINVSFQAAASSPFPATTAKCASDTLSLPEPSGFTGFAFAVPAAGGAIRNGQLQFFSQTATTYHVQEKDAHGCRVASDITVDLYPQPVIHIGNDTTICPGDSVELNAGSSFLSYTWNTGSSGAAIWVSVKNQYSVRALTADGCTVRDTMILANWVAPVVTLDHDTVLCAGSSRLLTAGNDFAAYLWNDGSISPDLEISEKGFYRVIVTDDHGCIASDSTTIRAIVPLPANFLPGDTTICQYGKLIITPKGSFSSYAWNDGSKGSSLTVSQPGLYYVQVTDKYNCPGSDSIFLTGKQCMEGFYIPGAFTPNGDGKNDVIRPLIFGNVEKYHFTIFNRNGQKVYESSALQNGWDGTFHGVAQPSGVFVWYCVYQLQGRESQTQKGTLLLIR
jgi:gliding motility-associated-like protein